MRIFNIWWGCLWWFCMYIVYCSTVTIIIIIIITTMPVIDSVGYKLKKPIIQIIALHRLHFISHYKSSSPTTLFKSNCKRLSREQHAHDHIYTYMRIHSPFFMIQIVVVKRLMSSYIAVQGALGAPKRPLVSSMYFAGKSKTGKHWVRFIMHPISFIIKFSEIFR